MATFNLTGESVTIGGITLPSDGYVSVRTYKDTYPVFIGGNEVRARRIERRVTFHLKDGRHIPDPRQIVHLLDLVIVPHEKGEVVRAVLGDGVDIISPDPDGGFRYW